MADTIAPQRHHHPAHRLFSSNSQSSEMRPPNVSSPGSPPPPASYFEKNTTPCLPQGAFNSAGGRTFDDFLAVFDTINGDNEKEPLTLVTPLSMSKSRAATAAEIPTRTTSIKKHARQESAWKPLRPAAPSPPGSPLSSGHWGTSRTPEVIESPTTATQYLANIHNYVGSGQQAFYESLTGVHKTTTIEDDSGSNESTLSLVQPRNMVHASRGQESQRSSTVYLRYAGCGCDYTVTHASTRSDDNASLSRSTKPERAKHKTSSAKPAPAHRPSKSAPLNILSSRPVGNRRRINSEASPHSYHLPSSQGAGGNSQSKCSQTVIGELAKLANPVGLYIPKSENADSSEDDVYLDITTAQKCTDVANGRTRNLALKAESKPISYSLPGSCQPCSAQSLPNLKTEVHETSIPTGHRPSTDGDYNAPSPTNSDVSVPGIDACPSMTMSRQGSILTVVSALRSPCTPPTMSSSFHERHVNDRISALLEEETIRNEAAEIDLYDVEIEALTKRSHLLEQKQKQKQKQKEDKPICRAGNIQDQADEKNVVASQERHQSAPPSRRPPRLSVFKATQDLAELVHGLALAESSSNQLTLANVRSISNSSQLQSNNQLKCFPSPMSMKGIHTDSSSGSYVNTSSSSGPCAELDGYSTTSSERTVAKSDADWADFGGYDADDEKVPRRRARVRAEVTAKATMQAQEKSGSQAPRAAPAFECKPDVQRGRRPRRATDTGNQRSEYLCEHPLPYHDQHYDNQQNHKHRQTKSVTVTGTATIAKAVIAPPLSSLTYSSSSASLAAKAGGGLAVHRKVGSVTTTSSVDRALSESERWWELQRYWQQAGLMKENASEVAYRPKFGPVRWGSKR